MTTDEERFRAMHRVREFLTDLLFPSRTPKVPKNIRDRAYRLAKHYPMEVEIDMIEQLQLRNAKLVAELEGLHDALEVEQNAVNHLHTDRNNLRLEVERLTRERDDARRRLCEELMESEGNPMFWKGAPGAAGIAERLGWDCFKEKP